MGLEPPVAIRRRANERHHCRCMVQNPLGKILGGLRKPIGRRRIQEGVGTITIPQTNVKVTTAPC